MRNVLLLSCPDRPGIVGGRRFVAEVGGNIVAADQHSDQVADGQATFLQRVEFDLPDTAGSPQRDFTRRSRRWPASTA